MPGELADFGFLIVAIRPDLMGPAETFRENASAFAQAVRHARPIADGSPVRMPFDRSRRDRQKGLAEDAIEVPDVLFTQLTQISQQI
jgi:delta1-piperideine-2-carboxylate reductase